jgi:hypothetical protein
MTILSQEWLRLARAALGDHALALVQGYPYIGFAGLSPEGKLSFPPQFSGVDLEAQKSRFWDVRVFSDRGEWHAFRRGGTEWGERRFPVGGEDTIECSYPLWGTDTRMDSGWTCCFEKGRGIEIWVPPVGPAPVQVPVKLKAKLVLGIEEETGLVGIVDAVLSQLV